jgi:hypothetical protein
MSNVVVVTSVYNERSFWRLLDSLGDATEEKPIVVDTNDVFNEILRPDTFHLVKVPPRLRNYASVMYARIQAAEHYCDNNTILCNFDDDYILNPHVIDFAQRVFDENEEIDHLSLLRGPNVPDMGERIYSWKGFNFIKWPSCMGGSLMVRWKKFYPLVSEYFEKYLVSLEDSGRGGMFDQSYFKFLSEKFGHNWHVYTLLNYSLVQHCDYGSIYGHNGHMYAERFDPIVDPLEKLR